MYSSNLQMPHFLYFWDSLYNLPTTRMLAATLEYPEHPPAGPGEHVNPEKKGDLSSDPSFMCLSLHHWVAKQLVSLPRCKYVSI